MLTMTATERVRVRYHFRGVTRPGHSAVTGKRQPRAPCAPLAPSARLPGGVMPPTEGEPMKPKNLPAVAVLIATAALTAGCSSAASSHAVTMPSVSPACTAALAMLPSSPPGTTQQAACHDSTLLGGRKGTTLDAMLDQLAADSFDIGMDLDSGTGNVTTAVAAFRADAAAVRSFCR